MRWLARMALLLRRITAINNQRVVAAYSPLGNTGLGMVAKLNTATLYQPILSQLQIIIPLLLFIIAAGLLLLYWQVLPLLQRIFASEKRLLASETRFRSAFNYAAIGMAIMGLTGRWLKVNQA